MFHGAEVFVSASDDDTDTTSESDDDTSVTVPSDVTATSTERVPHVGGRSSSCSALAEADPHHLDDESHERVTTESYDVDRVSTEDAAAV